MEMKVLKSENKLCTCCMEEHEVKTVLVKEQATYKNRKINYEASYMYCDTADELYMDEHQMQDNDLKMKNSYRRAEGLLTSEDICNIRGKYGITQSDLCILLGWGGKTITRYESHQVQDKAHDTILKKLDRDPEWFLSLLKDSKDNLTAEAYQKYLNAATLLYESDQDLYLRKAIEASYVRFQGNTLFQGNTDLSLDKVVDVIRYYASSFKISNLFKVKLMKLMWYADALSYKQRGFAITGLVYKAFPMGAVPVAHNFIIDLKDVPCEEVDLGETYAYHFSLSGESEFPALSEDDKRILDIVIEKLGGMSKDEIVAFMHREQAYIETAPRDVILFKYADNLQI
ncbi:type II TA system antitoxin MqsA family protein [Oribacterium sp. FC2011]|uniref:type II TA system antitoxin MqsA family protein n=1 Tax=Oribacterium sp. FC2011 TaxID=1408311 RepID=UPI000678CC31|nr:type II TA system antitoxin MqsA family protein [Oribacterium sp. FC2011]